MKRLHPLNLLTSMIAMAVLTMGSELLAQETPKGLVVFTNTPGLGADVALTVEFIEISEFPQVVNIRQAGATAQRRLMRNQVLEIMRYPNFGGTISSDAQIAALRADAERLTGMLVKYPRAKDTLQGAKSRFDFALQQVEAGKILVSGSWVPRQSPSSPSSEPTGGRIPELIVTDRLGTKKTYRDVKVVKVNEDGIQVVHAAGSATIRAESLPKDLRDKLKLPATPKPTPADATVMVPAKPASQAATSPAAAHQSGSKLELISSVPKTREAVLASDDELRQFVDRMSSPEAKLLVSSLPLIDYTPRIYLSPALQRLGVTAEFKPSEANPEDFDFYTRLRAAQAAKNWAEMASIMDELKNQRVGEVRKNWEQISPEDRRNLGEGLFKALMAQHGAAPTSTLSFFTNLDLTLFIRLDAQQLALARNSKHNVAILWVANVNALLHEETKPGNPEIKPGDEALKYLAPLTRVGGRGPNFPALGFLWNPSVNALEETYRIELPNNTYGWRLASGRDVLQKDFYLCLEEKGTDAQDFYARGGEVSQKPLEIHGRWNAERENLVNLVKLRELTPAAVERRFYDWYRKGEQELFQVFQQH